MRRVQRTFEYAWSRCLQKYAVGAGGCWIWQGSLAPNGYGRFNCGGRSYWVHRLGAALATGRTYDDQSWVAHHECHVRACINPDHLTPKGRAEHSADHHPRHAECSRGHDLAVHGYARPDNGRLMCRICQSARNRRRLLMVLSVQGPRIRPCQGCGGIFEARRIDKRFCTERCSNTPRLRAFRARRKAAKVAA